VRPGELKAFPGTARNEAVKMHDRVDFFRSHLEHCTLCPRRCGVNRLAGERGFCKAGSRLKVASYCLHRGEEPPVSGTAGSGTIFFSDCTMECLYCQNYPISQMGYGNPTEVADLAGMMLDLERRGAHNINLVTPTHYLPHIVEAVAIARDRGLKLPVLSNTSGYERPEIIRMLEGVVQIYLTDMRYSRSETASRYSRAPDYPKWNRASVKEMVDTAGPLACRGGIATSGVIVRHLLLPSLLAETREILGFVSGELPRSVPLSLMTQYFPAHRAREHPELDRKITPGEYLEALELMDEFAIESGWVQDPDSPPACVA
jgi:putative pyruvate formate lyase activating enzyme